MACAINYIFSPQVVPWVMLAKGRVCGTRWVDLMWDSARTALRIPLRVPSDRLLLVYTGIPWLARNLLQVGAYIIIHFTPYATTPSGINNTTVFNIKIIQLVIKQFSRNLYHSFIRYSPSSPVKYRSTGVRRDCVMIRSIWLVRNQSSHFPSATHNTSTPQTFW